MRRGEWAKNDNEKMRKEREIERETKFIAAQIIFSHNLNSKMTESVNSNS